MFYDEINKTYKIHNVLLDFLRMRQNFKSSEIQRLNRRLGNWYMDRRELLTAYSYYYKSEDYNIILTHLNNPNNIDNNLIDFDGVVSIFENLSEEELCKYPIAYLQYIFYVHLIYIYFREQGTFNKILQLAKLKFPNHAKLSNGCGTGAEYLAQAEYSLETAWRKSFTAE